MRIIQPGITARQAADVFAAKYDDEGREVGHVALRPGVALLFQFVGGVRWYAVTLLPDYTGWEVVPEVELCQNATTEAYHPTRNGL